MSFRFATRPDWLPCQGRHQGLYAEDSHGALQVIRQHVHTHLRVDFRQRLHQDMRRPHPRLERAEHVFHGLPASCHGVRHSIQPILHGVQDRFMFPARDTPVVARGAARFQRTARTGRAPVAVLREAAFKARHAIDRVLPGRALVSVALGEVDEIALVEQARCVIVGGQRLGHQGSDPLLLAFPDVLAIEIAPVGQHRETCLAGRLRRVLGHRRELLTVVSVVRHLVSHDQMVCRVDGDLHVVAHHAGAAATRGHGTGVWVGE